MTLIKGKAIDVSCGSRHSGLIVSDKNNKKTLAMCGAGEAGQLGTGKRDKETAPVFVEFNESIFQVACGIFQTGVLTSSGQVYMTGGNSFGQLGLGNKKNHSRLQKLSFFEGICIQKIFCNNFSAAISDKGQLFV